MAKAWFLDRDGTIIIDKNYLSDPNLIEFLPNSIEALKLAQELGYILIVITNQSGVGRGYFSLEQANNIQDVFCKELLKHGITITKSYICPHYDSNCDCRKPQTGMFEQAIKDFNLNPIECIACGDKERDIINLTNLGLLSSNLGIIDNSNFCDILSFFQKVRV